VRVNPLPAESDVHHRRDAGIQLLMIDPETGCTEEEMEAAEQAAWQQLQEEEMEWQQPITPE
jgi:hypothetical protein